MGTVKIHPVIATTRRESRRRTVLRAVERSSWVMNHEESNTTLMMAVTGGAKLNGIWEQFHHHRPRLYSTFKWGSNGLYYLTGFGSCLGIFSADISFGLACLYFLAVLWSLLHHASFINFRIFKEVFKEFDTMFFMAELVMYEVAQWGLFCFDFRGFLLSFGKFIWIILFILYDCFPLYYRIENRRLLTLGCFMLTTLLSVFYLGVPHGVCYYTYNLSHRVVCQNYQATSKLALFPSLSPSPPPTASSSLGDDDICTRTSQDDVVFYLLNFYFNRGITILLLLIKIVVWSYIYPDDCVVVSSHVRVTEKYLTVEEEGKEEGRRKNVSYT